MKRRNFIKYTAISPLAIKDILSISSGDKMKDMPVNKSAASKENKVRQISKQLSPSDLLCEYISNPLGIDVNQPRLTWVSASGKRGQRQKAYHIIVATSAEKLNASIGDAWDSGKTDSDQQTHVVYAGKTLESGRRYYWKVRLWNQKEEISAWSTPAFFETGLLNPEDWHAHWIARKPDAAWRDAWQKRRKQQEEAKFDQHDHDLFDVSQFFQPPYEPAPLFRKEINIQKVIKSARIYICGLGYNKLFINGEKVGDHVLDPAWTNYDKRVLYSTYDVTANLMHGQNTIGVMLGRGWYTIIYGPVGALQEANWINQPRLIFQMIITYSDGSQHIIVSDETWKSADGPVLFDCINSGEIYDARREVQGWNQNTCDITSWNQANEVAPPGGCLSAQMIQPIKVMDIFPPKNVTQPKEGVSVYDFGKHFSGWIRIKVKGKRDTRIVMDLKETLEKDGTVEKVVGGQPSKHTQAVYILKGNDAEEYETSFVYWGLRYAEITSSDPYELLDMKGCFVYSSIEENGSFRCSDQMVNKLHQNILQTHRSNFHGMQTDCPTREKIGWTGDTNVSAISAIYNFDIARLYNKWLTDLKDRQEEHGRIPAYSPLQANHLTIYDSSPWCVSIALIPWYMYQYYDDRRILEVNYPAMKLWLEGIEKRDGVQGRPRIVKGGASDWAAPPDNPSSKEGSLFWGTLFYYFSAHLMTQIAGVLGHNEDVEPFAHLAGQIKDVFNETFFDPEKGYYKVENHTEYRQSANAVPLFFGIVPGNYRDQVIKNLIQDITVIKNVHLWTGILGTRYIMELLPLIGHNELAFKLLTQKTYPSWGYPILELDATTVWEYWEPRRSRNHPAYCSVAGYLYKYLAGIQIDSGAYGFKKIIFNPQVPKDLSWAEASYKSIRGTIVSGWAKTENNFTMDITLPANTSGVVMVPALNIDNPIIKESGQIIWEKGRFRPNVSENVQFVENGYSSDGTIDHIIFAIESGQYKFQLSS
jgi:alpha-L-rhamnosidase